MMKKIWNIICKITENYFVVVSIALLVGIFFADFVVNWSKFSTFFLAIIFFLSSLKIDLLKVKQYFNDVKMLVVINIFMLLLLPILVYFVTDLIYPSLAIAFLLLATMPSGMTAPLLAEISGGKQSLSLVLTVVTSLLAPITVPLMIKLLIGAEINVSFWAMFQTLAIVIYIPFISAQFIKYFWQKHIDRVSVFFKPTSVIFLGLLIMVIVAKQSDVIIQSFTNGGEAIWYLVALCILFIILHFLGFYTIFWRGRNERITITVCLTYMNFTLAIELANKFFTEPNIIIPVVFSVIPWSLMFIPYKRIVRKFVK